MDLKHLDDDVLGRCAVEDSGMSFKGKAMFQLFGPVVYAFMKWGQPMYVGMSKRGMARIAGIRRPEEGRQLADEIRVWPCKGISQAKELENYLITRLAPPLNRKKRKSFITSHLGLLKAPH